VPTRLRITAALSLLLAAGSALAQTARANLSFDVASVRPSAPLDPAKMQAAMAAGKMPRFGAHVDASRAEYSYMSLRDLIANAYGVKSYQITGPDWLPAQRFDIVATLPQGATKDDAPKMLQALLADRFKVAAHRETQEHPVYALVVAKGGPKLKEAPPAQPIDPDAPLKPGEMKMETQDGPIRITRNTDGSTTANMGAKGIMTQRMDMQAQMLHLDSSTVTMQGFADMLTNFMTMGGPGGKQVIDMTDLKGSYQVAVEISIADLMAAARSAGLSMAAPPPTGGAGGGAAPAAAGAASLDVSDPGGGGTSLFKSVEALGLKLDSRKAKVEQLIIDHAEKNPTEN
jgi:uncharacterized protein (TIGR03435 family)